MVDLHGRQLRARTRRAAAIASSGSSVDEVGPPVPLQSPAGYRPSKSALQRREGHRLHAVERRARARGSARAARPPAPSAGVAPDDAAHLLQVQLLGERRRGRHGEEGEEAVELLGRSAMKLAVPVAGPPPPARSARTSARRRPCSTGCSRNRNEVTTPKLPPPPRIAQNRSGFSSALARDEAAVGEHHVGRRAGCRSSARAPRVRWPMPPPSVSPPTPVVEMMPLGVARPKAWVAWSTSPSSAAAADRHGARRRDRRGRRSSRQVDHQPVVHAAQAAAVVPAAADREVRGRCRGRS